MARDRANFNWAPLARGCLLLSILLALWTLWPAGQCTGRVMQGVRLSGLSEDSEFNDWLYSSDQYRQDTRGELNRVREADGFVGQFFGASVACYRAHPIERQAPWKPAGAGGSFLLFLLLRFIQRKAYQAQVRAASRRSRETRSSIQTVAVADGAERPVRRAAQVSGNHAIPLSGGADMLDRMGRETASPVRVAAGATGAPSAAASAPGAPQTRTQQSANTNGGLDLDAELMNLLNEGPSPTAAPPAVRAPAAAPSPTASHAVAPPSQAPADELDALLDDLWSDQGQRTGMHVVAPAPAIEPRPSGITGAFAAATAADPLYLKAPDAWLLADDLKLAVSVVDRAATLFVEFVDSRASVHPAWSSPRPVSEFVGAGAAGERAVLTVPRQSLLPAFLGVARSTPGDVTLRLTLTGSGAEAVATCRTTDRLTLEFAGPEGSPSAAVLVRIKPAHGHTLRAGIGDAGPGRILLVDIPPGPCLVQFEDSTRVRIDESTSDREFTMATDGWAIAEGSFSGRDGAVRRLIVLPPTRVLVRPGADPSVANGSAEAPFATMQAAIAAGLQRRPSALHTLEVRVDAPGQHPADRERSIGAGVGLWTAWWEGRSIPAGTTWTRRIEAADLRQMIRAFGGGLPEDLSIDDVTNLWLGNAAWAALRDAAASSVEARAQLDQTIARTPQALLLGGLDGQREVFRMRISNCSEVVLEGLHFLGEHGQNGLLVERTQGITLRRCCLDAFEAGPSARTGVYAVGRALQLVDSGHQNAPVRVEHCELACNRAVRPKMPVRGAAIDAASSWLWLSRCAIHGNLASAEPIDLAIDARSVIRGDATNYRAGNMRVDG